MTCTGCLQTSPAQDETSSSRPAPSSFQQWLALTTHCLDPQRHTATRHWLLLLLYPAISYLRALCSLYSHWPLAAIQLKAERPPPSSQRWTIPSSFHMNRRPEAGFVYLFVCLFFVCLIRKWLECSTGIEYCVFSDFICQVEWEKSGETKGWSEEDADEEVNVSSNLELWNMLPYSSCKWEQSYVVPVFWVRLGQIFFFFACSCILSIVI